MFTFKKPTPSLCDTCKNAYVMMGGTISIGDETYKQRYCSKQGSSAQITSNGHTFFQGISFGGYDKCPTFEEKKENGNSEI